jgi:hypothetical protein
LKKLALLGRFDIGFGALTLKETCFACPPSVNAFVVGWIPLLNTHFDKSLLELNSD